MKFFEQLEQNQHKTNSLVCIGLDVDYNKLPKSVMGSNDPVFEFNKAIIDKTSDIVCCYKPNIAFYEALGLAGLKSLVKTAEYIHENGQLMILDAKRNDIGNTAKAYARSAYETYFADALTVNPYMGEDSVVPFLNTPEKSIFVLARTSNPGGDDFQNLLVEGEQLYLKVVQKCLEWDKESQIGFVVGATYPEELGQIRTLAPQATFLVPGIGAQGGDIEKTLQQGLRSDGLGLIINSSRGIIYAGDGPDFADAARAAAITLNEEINSFRGAQNV